MKRRSFLRAGAAAAAAAVAPDFFVSRLLRSAPPSETIGFGIVGTGGMGNANIDRVLALKGARIVGICDVDKKHLADAKAKIERAQKGDGCVAVGDFRDLVARPDIDAVIVATPDHWHALPAIAAARAGKDVYVEKPLTLTVAEGRALVDAVRRFDRVGQTGTQQRSEENFRKACAAVRAGRLGELRRFEILIPGNNKFCAASWTAEPVPAELDYDLWLGPAPDAPYTRDRCHYKFRFIQDYALGQVTNWGVHYIDIAHWMLGPGIYPKSIVGRGAFPTTGLFTTATHVDFEAEFPNGIVMSCRTRGDGKFDGSLRVVGSAGEIRVTRSSLEASSPTILADLDDIAVLGRPQLPHMEDFTQAMRTRKPPVADVGDGHLSTTTCILGHLAMYLRRPLSWDGVHERFVDDPIADRFLFRPMRGKWSLASV